ARSAASISPSRRALSRDFTSSQVMALAFAHQVGQFSLQAVGEARPGTGEPGHNGSRRHACDFGDLVVRPFLHLAPDNGFAELRRELIHALPDHARALLLQGLGLRCGPSAGVDLFAILGLLAARAIHAEPREGGVAHDGEEPGTAALSAKAGKG